MSRHTRVGIALWDWEPFVNCSPVARCLWLALYTSAASKRQPPGLWHGGVATLSDAARLSAQDTIAALAELVEREMVEHDSRSHVIAMIVMPDNGERPSNGSAVQNFWSKFGTIPECPTRNRWVDLLEWMIGPMTSDHERVWTKTFATVRRKPKKKSDRARPTEQPDLFDRVIPGTSDTVSDTVSDTHWYTDLGSGSGSDLSPDSKPGATSDQPDAALLISTLHQHSAGAFPAVWDQRLTEGVSAALRAAEASGFTMADVEVLGAWLASGAMAWRADSLGALWIAKPGNLVEALDHARTWNAAGRQPAAKRGLALVPAAPAPGRVEPPPPATWTGGRRQL